MKCPICGAQVAADAKFCSVCGEKIEVKADTTVVVEEEPVVAPNNKKDIGKILGMISAIIGGVNAATILIVVLFSVISAVFSFCCCPAGCLGCFSCSETLIELAVCIVPLILGIVSVALGVVGMILSKKAGKVNVVAVIGLVLGVVSLALLVIVVIASIIWGLLATFILPPVIAAMSNMMSQAMSAAMYPEYYYYY